MKRTNSPTAAPLLWRIAACTAATLTVAIAAPAVASAAGSTVFVSPNPVKGPFSSCATPGYNSIQEAITVNAAKTTIHVCAGTYTEQVVLPKEDTIAGDAGATLKLPASPAATTSPCANEPEEQDLFMVCTGGKVSISGLELDGAWPSGTCNDELYTLNTGGGVKLTLTGSKVLHAGAVPLNGCQGGVGVRIGRRFTHQVATAKLTGDTIEGYQKGGILVDGPGSSAKMSGVTVTGIGPTPEIAQNGIQISRGAKAKISGATVTGNECDNVNCGENDLEKSQSGGVIILGQASGVKVSSSNISKNDFGIDDSTGFESEAPSESTKATISGNTLEENRDEGMILEEGTVKLTNNSIIGNGKAKVGIQLLQFEANPLGLKATGSGDGVTGMTTCGVEGLSDMGAADKLESLRLTHSLGKFSGNTQPLCNHNEAKIVISVS